MKILLTPVLITANDDLLIILPDSLFSFKVPVVFLSPLS